MKNLVAAATLALLSFSPASFASTVNIANTLTSFHCYQEKLVGIPDVVYELARNSSGQSFVSGRLLGSMETSPVFYLINSAVYDTVTKQYILDTVSGPLQFSTASGRGYFSAQRLMNCTVTGNW